MPASLLKKEKPGRKENADEKFMQHISRKGISTYNAKGTDRQT